MASCTSDSYVTLPFVSSIKWSTKHLSQEATQEAICCRRGVARCFVSCLSVSFNSTIPGIVLYTSSAVFYHQLLWRQIYRCVGLQLNSVMFSSPYPSRLSLFNKCIVDDTKAAACQSPNCILKNKIKYGEKRFSIWRMEFLHSAMWHVALESWQWIHQVAAPCNVISGSRITFHWIRPIIHHNGILHVVSISTISPLSTCYYAPVSEILSKSDHSRQKKMTSCRFSRWRISAILDFRNPITGSLKSPCTTSYRSSIDTIAIKCLGLRKSRFLYFGDRQTDKQTDEQMDSIDALSRSRCRKRRAAA